jgi:hypothetical protein
MKARFRPGTEVRATLAEVGIGKKLSSRAQKKAALPKAEQDRLINEGASACWPAGCLCGALCYEARGTSSYIGYCFCGDCRKASGSGSMGFAAGPRSDATAKGLGHSTSGSSASMRLKLTTPAAKRKPSWASVPSSGFRCLRRSMARRGTGTTG